MLIIFNCLTINVLSVIPNGFFFSMLCDSEWYYFIYNVESLIQNGIILFIML